MAGKTTERRLRRNLKRDYQYYIMALPAVVVMMMFNYLPMTGLVVVFKNYNARDGIYNSPWVGFQNFEFFFKSPMSAIRATTNTLILNSMFIIVGTVVAITLALFLNEVKNKIFKGAAQSIVFLPYFLSWVVIGSILYALLSDKGSINTLLLSLGLDKVKWYASPQYWRFILLCTNLWKFAGYSSVIYLAAIANIDTTYYEAATVDGATRARQIFAITIPFLKRTIIILTLMNVGRILYGDMQQIMAQTRNNPILIPTTDIIDTLVYRSIMTSRDFAFASAINLYQSIVGLLIVLLANFLVKRYDEDYRLF
ncbi:MAG: ABC transporter permease subunit [Oscillospiraceae bacterium]|nr:ABC transporter permease subunit [Oscillospiraceae bacterium]